MATMQSEANCSLRILCGIHIGTLSVQRTKSLDRTSFFHHRHNEATAKRVSNPEGRTVDGAEALSDFILYLSSLGLAFLDKASFPSELAS